jgi:hypothetical protein
MRTESQSLNEGLSHGFRPQLVLPLARVCLWQQEFKDRIERHRPVRRSLEPVAQFGIKEPPAFFITAALLLFKHLKLVAEKGKGEGICGCFQLDQGLVRDIVPPILLA